MILKGGLFHDDKSITVDGLKRLMSGMRWQDLEQVACELDLFRRADGADDVPEVNDATLTAEMIMDWTRDD